MNCFWPGSKLGSRLEQRQSTQPWAGSLIGHLFLLKVSHFASMLWTGHLTSGEKQSWCIHLGFLTKMFPGPSGCELTHLGQISVTVGPLLF